MNTLNSNPSCLNAAPYYFVNPIGGANTTVVFPLNTYTLSVTSTKYNSVGVWIDWNQNLIFEPSEYYNLGVNSTGNSWTGSQTITVPSDAIIGQTSMRVRTEVYFYNLGANNACTNTGYGETEDYTITVAPLVAPEIISLGSTTACAGTNLTINGINLWGATSANVTIGGTPVSSITLNTGNQLIVTIGNGTSGIVSVTTPAGTAVSSGSFTVNPYPETPANPNSNSPQCPNSGVTLTRIGSPTASETWYWQTSANGVSTANSESSYNTLTSGTYYLRSQNDITGCWCNGAGSASVVVNPVPTTVTLSPPNPSVCLGGTAQLLTASGGTIGGNFAFGTATTTNTTEGYPAPYTNWYGGTKHQMLIRASELTTAGMVAGPINSISFTVAGVGASFSGSLASFQISMKNTSSSVVSGTSFESGLTLVYGPLTQAIPTTGLPAQVTHTITPFIWDGTSNILIETSYSNANIGSYVMYVLMHNSDPGFLSTNYYYADSQTPAYILAGATPSGSGNARPNITLGSSVPTNITWSPQNGLFTNSGASIPYVGAASTTVYALPAATTAYTATSTASGTGCITTAGTTVTIVPGATITTHPAAAIKCAGQTATFMVEANVPNLTYSWRKNTIPIDPITNPSAATASLTINNVTALDAGDYSVVVSADCGLPVTSDVAVLTVKPVPTISASSNSPICSGSTLNLIGTNDIGSTFSWTGPNGFTSSSLSPTIPAASVPATGTYSFSASLDGCVSLVGSTNVVVNPTPTAITVTPSSATLCVNGSSQLLTANGGIIGGNYTLGTSATTNDLNTYPAPYSNYYGGTKHQMLIRASELTSAGIVAGPISSISFTVASVGSTFTGSLSSFQISMKNTSTSVLSISSFESGLTLVYGPLTQAIPKTGLPAQVTHNITPFTWNGTSNIIIETSYSNANTGASTDGVQMRYSDPGFVSTNYYRADGQTSAIVLAAATPSGSGNARPNIVLGSTIPTSITWAQQSGLFTNAGATLPYSGGAATSVYALPATSTTYTVTATAPSTGCASSNTVNVAVNAVTSISSQSTNGQTQCIGGSFAPISVTASGANLSYQWYKNTNASTSGGTSVGANSNSYTPFSSTAGTLYYYCIVTGICGTATSAVSGVFIVNSATIINSQSTATQTQCVGGSFAAISVIASGTGTLSYQWYKNSVASTSGGTAVGTNANSYTPLATDVGTFYYYCIVHGSCGDVTSAISGAIIVNPPSNVSVNISCASNTVCPNSAITFNATPTNGGSTPSYQWYVNDVLTVSDSVTNGLVAYFPFNGNANDESGNGNNGTVYGPTLTNDHLGNSNSAYLFSGNYIQVPQVHWSAIGTGDFSIGVWVKPTTLAGDYRMILVDNVFPDNFQLNFNNQGNCIQMYLGGQLAGQSSNSTFTLSQWYYITVTRKAGVLKFYINGQASGSSTSTQNIQQSTYLAIGYRYYNSSHPFVGSIDDIRIYQRGLSSSEIFTQYTNGGGPTMTYIPSSNDQVKCVLNSNLSCIANNPATSNIITVAFKQLTSINSQSTAAQTQCLNGDFTPISVSANGTNLMYQWFSNTVESTSGGSSLGSDNGAQTNSYTPQATNSGTLYYYCIIHGDCGADATSAVSGAFIVNSATVISNQSTATQNQCINGIFSPISVIANGAGTLSYQLYKNAVVSTTGGTAVGTNSDTYTPLATTVGTLYYYCVVHSSCGTDVTSAVSGAFIVNPATAINSQSTAGQTQCINGSFTAISVTASGTGTLSYHWFKNTVASTSGGTAVGTDANTYTPLATTAGTLYYYCVVHSDCGADVTSDISGAFIVNPITTISSQSTATQTQCINGNFTPISVTASGLGTLNYQWFKNTVASTSGGTAVGTNSNSYTPLAATVGTLYYYCVVQNSCGNDIISAVSGAFIVSPTSVGGSISGTSPITYGSSTGTLTISSYVGSILNWEKKLNSGSWTTIANTNATYSEYPTAAGSWSYRAVVKSGSCASVYSDVFSLSVNPKALNITADDKFKNYDGTVFTGYTVNYSGFVLGDTYASLGGSLTFNGSAITATSLGFYTIVPSGQTSSNYSIIYNNGTLEIFTCNSTATVTITSNDGNGSLRYAINHLCNNGTIAFADALNNQTITLTSGTLVIDKNIILDNHNHVGGVTIAGTGDNFTIYASKSLTLAANSKITVLGKIVNNAGVSGLVINAGASFIQNTTNLPATVKGVLSNKWHLFGSPFQQSMGATLSNITPIGGSTQLKPYINGTNWLANVTSAYYFLQPTVGYAVCPSIAVTASLSGNLFNGLAAPCDYSIPLVYNGTAATQSWNLLSNPFPSYLNWNSLGKTNLSTTLYLWNPAVMGPPVTNTSYFSVYNSANGVGVPVGTLPYISPLQGFFVRAISTNPRITLPLSARTHSTSTFYKDASNTEILVRLKTETDMGYDELVVCKNPDAKFTYEDYDSEKMFDGLPVGMYSQAASGEKLVINTISDTNTIIPLGIIGTVGDKAKITAFAVDRNVPVYLEDRLEGITQQLTENSSYEFEFLSDEVTGRFYIRFKGTTKVLTNSDINVFETDNVLNVIAQTGEEIQSVEVFTLTGACIFKATPSSCNVYNAKIDLSSAIYLVRVKTSMGTKNAKVNWE